ncbi:MAG: 16S rRNA (cytosine(1402)-N(4))-methyltransferase [Candidatus Staskawiczbacteria bacterium RIFOXYB2_FULL_32_9]|uniref:Ribosomal RNA small subunit methyltransferase H n=1 Tax=Candidatus Staskawiczbacteria bacterium RIFOXYD1_FULL_32_13 TaxID=1802234 RepID=A0A1G2JKD6_9BACT|nr:MAG: Ribosomal RNA small subunit methyltransferase H [Parcubacteria group bacterium GW2011_GWC2_32_10]OGZ78215.1 MAG: 16S rRNA (cytosine(1402)-N(4))-methyltransferase [Candidatus Staskawiczbacteria bacterium RIFOXYA2_FULL_32_7]OGZ83827.1 MAG: 16S rRNA (cytosine(1402)-N(4))-methyltransferase [Candidatus Staskawiczbacteria bacterium RIFOXYB2_FULL_32_9]OGZ85917.1 MAG: 16S rRNA (cytosine(1402)-N(4))-methyltransferase [Candidatus Staskawiczbacteria bacterium RIFOXYC2_FULL_32_10]OGZ87606.1 MAG: 16
MHIPVLLNEVIEYLDPKANENFVDCTIGQGGHTKVILEKNAPNGKVLGIDLDAKQIENCKLLKREFGERLILVNDNYANLTDIINKNNFTKVNGILADIGFSSFQIEGSTRGFSFLKDENLDMRYSTEITNDKLQITNTLTAKKIVNEFSQQELEKILEEYGEERFAKQIAKKITEERKINKIETTFELVEVIKKAIPAKFQYDRIHCATRTFQALRIAVNGELENLKKFLPQALSVLSSDGRLVIISFHSLEDRIVKNYFKQEAEKGTIKILTKKPIEATEGEINNNARARSAKLRAIVKL